MTSVVSVYFRSKTKKVQTTSMHVGYLWVLSPIIMYNKYVGPLYCPAEMYAGCIAYCHLVSHGEYADRTDRHTERRTDALPLHYAVLRFPLDGASVKMLCMLLPTAKPMDVDVVVVKTINFGSRRFLLSSYFYDANFYRLGCSRCGYCKCCRCGNY